MALRRSTPRVDLSDLFAIFPDLRWAPLPRRSFAQQLREAGRRISETRYEYQQKVIANRQRADWIRAQLSASRFGGRIPRAGAPRGLLPSRKR
jgi:hypothetical protein